MIFLLSATNPNFTVHSLWYEPTGVRAQTYHIRGEPITPPMLLISNLNMYEEQKPFGQGQVLWLLDATFSNILVLSWTDFILMGNVIDLRQVTGTLYHSKWYQIHLWTEGDHTLNFSGERHCLQRQV